MSLKMKKDSIKKVITDSSLSSYLSDGTAVEGIVQIRETTTIDGRIKGRIVGEQATVMIGEAAEIEGEILVDVAIIKGNVNGVITAASRTEIYPPACISGDIKSPVIAIEAGAIINNISFDRPVIRAAGEIVRDAASESSK